MAKGGIAGRIVRRYEPEIAIDALGDWRETCPRLQAERAVTARCQKGKGVDEPVAGTRERRAAQLQ
jgi:hypothetical protein